MFRALEAVQLYLAGLRGKGPTSLPEAWRSPRVTTLLECEVRMTVRTSTGVSKRSDSWMAVTTKSLASWLSAGSRSGIFMRRAYQRLSCSFCELNSPGSSAVTTTSPASAPVYTAYNSESDSTFMPTCLVVTMARLPA